MTRLPPIEVRRPHMATEFTFVLSPPDASASARVPAVLLRAHERVERLEAELSEFRAESCVARLNRARAGERVPFSGAALELLELSERVRIRSRGTFDALAKSACPLHPRPIAWDAREGVAWRLDERAHLGFGAIGKGFALDQVRVELEREGFRDYLLSAGGSSIVVSGLSAPGRPWTCGWGFGRDADGDLVGVELEHRDGRAVAIGVSGTLEQGEHLIEPGKAAPARAGELRSALVTHSSAAVADALSTALFVGGWERSVESFSMASEADLPGLAAIDQEGRARWNGIFRAAFGGFAAAGALGTAAAFADDSASEVIDLDAAPTQSGEGVPVKTLADDFSPYSFERASGWLLPAAAMALYTLWHLRRSRHSRTRRPIMDPASGRKPRV